MPLSAFRECDPPTSSITAPVVVFFDGGSRGNPGLGGAGAVIARADVGEPRAATVWTGSVSLAARTTTNNRVECLGLICELQAPSEHAVGKIHVVGDSVIIMAQMRSYKTPKCRAFQQLYVMG